MPSASPPTPRPPLATPSRLPPSAADRDGPGRMKAIALALLLAAAALYILSRVMDEVHPAWSYVGAFAEAAVIGAMADWFAVVALFRRPLGLPIPHTAIVPSNKSRIGRNLAGFIVGNFLATDQVLEKLRRFGAGARLAGWLADPLRAAQLSRHLASAAGYAIGILDDERVRGFIRSALVARLAQADVSGIAGRLLDLLTADRRHQALLDEALRQLSQLLEDEAVQEKIAALIADDLKLLRYVGLSQIAARLATERLIAGFGRLVGEVGADETHPLRLRFDDFVQDFVERLKTDPALRERVGRLQQELLAHPQLHDYLQGLWEEARNWLRRDLASDDSRIRSRLADAALALGTRLQADLPMQQWIDAQLLEAAPRWIERYREDIRAYIVARVDEWDTAELTDELERNIGRDLQFVRINGTLVGGLIGLSIHAATQWLG